MRLVESGNNSRLMRVPSVSHVPEGPTAKKEKTLKGLFHDTLKDIYFAERKILTALPKMAKAAQSDKLLHAQTAEAA